MKTLQLYLGSLLLALLVGCGEGNKGSIDTEMDDGQPENSYRDPAEGSPSVSREGAEIDSADLQSDRNEEANSGLPPEVFNAIQNDPSLKNLKMVDSRRFNKEAKVYYEVVFENGDKTRTITFDEAGNYSGDLD